VSAPVQVLVVGFDEPRFSGEVLAELERLRAAGVVRLVDVLLVSRDENGTFETLPPPPEADTELGRVAAQILGLPEGGDGQPERFEGDTWSLDDAVPAGSTGAVALIEHMWARPLVEAIRSAGGRLLDETWLAPDDVERLGTLTR
jgi:hypothetical protein